MIVDYLIASTVTAHREVVPPKGAEARLLTKMIFRVVIRKSNYMFLYLFYDQL